MSKHTAMNAQSILRSFETILEMLGDRGHNVGNITRENLAQIVELDSIKPVIEIKLDDVKIVYATQAKFKLAEIKKFFQDEDEPFTLYLLVVQDTMTQSNLKSIADLKMNIEVYPVQRLQFNITKHMLVPKHEVIRDKVAIDAILESFKLKSRTQLPIILKTDPIARYYGMKSGDLVKVTRNSPTAGEHVIYRCCL